MKNKKWALRADISTDCRTIVKNVQAELMLSGKDRTQDEVVEYIIFNCRPLPHSIKFSLKEVKFKKPHLK